MAQSPPICPICELRDPQRAHCRRCGPGARPEGGAAFGPFDLLRGLGFFVQGLLELLAAPAYRGRLGLAVLANLLAWLAAAAAAFYGVFHLVAGAVSDLPDWLAGLASWAGGLLALLLSIGIGVYLFPVLFVLLLFPILDPISRIAEARILGWDPAESVRGFWGDFADGISTAMRTLLWQLLALVVTLPLALTGIGLPLAILISAFFAGFAWIDYPLARRGFGFRRKWRRSIRNGWLLCGFGLGFQLALLIPFVGFLVATPAAAVASAHVYHGMRRRES